jgi:type II restriction enzyme
MVIGGHIVDRHTVNSRYKKISPLKELKPRARGWTMAVLNEIQKSGWKEFTTKQAYCFEEVLHIQFPGNSNVRAKIRQQLQVLRDLKILDHLSQGCWRYC